jgi:VWFA-related protein
MSRRLSARPLVAVCVALTVVLLSVARPYTQERVPGTIRVRVTLVPIDVVVTDKDDRPVTDLKASDFTILEDGVRQAVAHFSLQSLAAIPADPSAPPKALLRKIPTAELTPETGRTFLIVLGRGRLQAPSKGIDGLLHFVRTELLPQDLVAVLAYNRATDFTSDHDKVAQVLERFKKYHEGIEAKMALHFSGLGAVYGSREIPKGIQPEIAKIFDAPGAVGARQLPPGQVTGERQMRDDARDVVDTMQRAAMADAAGASLDPLETLRADSLTDLPFDDYVSSMRATSQDLQNLYTAVEYLRYMEGEKHLLFFTENGLFLPRLEHDESLAAMANDARVTIDTFQTGGRSSIHASVPEALTKLNELTRAEYLLGYYPKNGDWNGKYRKLVVRVNRPDLKLSYRRGYYARQSLQPFDRKAFLSYSRISAAAAYEEEVKDLAMHVSVRAVPSESGTGQDALVDVVLQVSKIPFAADEGRHVATLQVTTFYGDGRGRFLGEAWQTLNLNLKDDTWQKAQKDGLPFSMRVPVQADNQTFKVVVYSYEADKVGSALARLR